MSLTPGKGYIDLSKRRVTAEDIQKADDKFTKSKSVHSIMRHVAEKLDMSLEELYKTIGWPLYKKYGHAYDAFKVAISYVFDFYSPLCVGPFARGSLHSLTSLL